MIIAYIVFGVLAGVLGIVGLILVLPWFKNDNNNLVIDTRVIAPSEGNPHIASGHEHEMRFVDDSITLIIKRYKHESRYKKEKNL